MTIQELSARSGVPVRTIRFYIAERLLSGPEGRGPSAEYGDDHLNRLGAIRDLALIHMPLAEIREKLRNLGPGDLDEVVAETTSYLMPEASFESPRAYIGTLLSQARARRGGGDEVSLQSRMLLQEPSVAHVREPAGQYLPRNDETVEQPSTWGEPWRRITLAPGVELHVSDVADESQNELVARILDLAMAQASPQSQSKSQSKKRNRRKS